jgi:tetratricopeptide (TPR) repeat protein
MKRTSLAVLFAFSLQAQPGDPRSAHWVRLTTSDFDLYTCAPEKEGRELLRSFEQIRGFFQKASPVPLLEDFPIRVVAFESKDQFSFYAPSGRVAAYYAPGPRTDYIVMASPARDNYPFAIHEYMHLLIRRSGLRVPVWLNEGWADVYSTLRPMHGGVAVGDLLQDRVKLLETSPWLNLDALFSVTSDSRLVTEGSRVGIFYAESWALVHMLFLSPEYSDNFPKFLSALNRGLPAAEAFQTAWQRTPQQVFQDLQTYMKRRRVNGRIFEAPLGNPDSAVEVSKPDSFDTRLLLADLAIGLNRRAEVKQELEALALLRPNNMLVSEGLGFAALSIKDSDTARANFEKAFAEGDANPLMCLKLALLEDAAKQPPERMRGPLERAVQSKPDYGDALFELGVFHAAMGEFQPAVDTLMKIRKVTPDRAPAVFATLAYSYLRTGDLDKARANARTAKEWSQDRKQQARDDEIISLADARAKSPFAPHLGEKNDRAAGILRAVECQGESHRLVLAAGDKILSLDLPDPTAIEVAHAGPDANLQLSCGPQNPIRIVVDYAPGSVMQVGSAGIVRRIEF